MANKQAVTNMPTFTQEGVLVPRGTVVSVDTSKLGAKARPGNERGKPGNMDNLDDVGEFNPRAVAPIASISPTGPAPVRPQQLPPGTVQMGSAYVDPQGARLVPETGVAGEGTEEVEEEQPQRTQASQADDTGSEDTFDAAAVLDGTLDDVEPRIAALKTVEEVEAVRAAAGDSIRAGATKALDKRKAELESE